MGEETELLHTRVHRIHPTKTPCNKDVVQRLLLKVDLCDIGFILKPPKIVWWCTI